MKKNKELHLFILWEKSRHKEKEILEDIGSNFEIIRTFNIHWSEELFAENLSRLYGKKLLKTHRKSELCGTGDFLLVMVYDHDPIYREGVNAKTASYKRIYREMTGGGHLIHGSDNLDEVEDSLIFLLHKNSKEFLKTYKTPWNGKHININQEIIGAPCWQDEKELISFIEKLPETTLKKVQDTHLIIAKDVAKICRFLNASKRMFFMKRNLYRVPLSGEDKFIYIRKPLDA
ncbi:MAG: hypothetical protein LBL47_03985 [Lactobacillus sp.]|nr:hypothetical protein [Lactobacillus sp.]